MDGVDLLDCFISQYRPNIHAKKWYYPLVLNCINMICIAACRLHVILQRDPQTDYLDFTRSVVIELLKNAVRSETARGLKSGRPVANQSIGQHQPVDCVKQGRCVWCEKNTTKECYECKVRLHAIAFRLIMQRFWNDAITPLITDQAKFFCNVVLSLVCLVCHIAIVCQYYNKFAFLAHSSSGRKKSLQAKRTNNAFVQKHPFTTETIINQIKYSFNR